MGESFEQALVRAQALGIAERDPKADLEGWDASVKASILSTVVLGRELRPDEVHREPLDQQVAARAQAEARAGRRLRMVLELDGSAAAWTPQTLSPRDPLFMLDGFSMGLELQTDRAGHLFVALLNPDVRQTAFALLADFVVLARSRAASARLK
jgi:homoserine dehydrogenase